MKSASAAVGPAKVAVKSAELSLKSAEAAVEVANQGVEAANHAIREAEFASDVSLATPIVSVVVALLLTWLIVRSITKPMSEMTSAMGRLAEGDLDAEVPAQNKTDEIGQMAGAVQILKENAIEMKRLEQEKLERAMEEAQQQKDAQRRSAQQQKEMMAKLAGDFDERVSNALGSVTSSASQMKATAEVMTETAQQTNNQATTASAASQQASSSVQTVAAAAEELASSIGEIAQQVTQSSDIAGSAVAEAQRADEMVQGLEHAGPKNW